jgi:hypothetical protein
MLKIEINIKDFLLNIFRETNIILKEIILLMKQSFHQKYCIRIIEFILLRKALLKSSLEFVLYHQ